MNDNNIVSLTIRELVSSSRYLIPIYQRNYDWGEKETLQLLEDISDYAAQKTGQPYYLGSLIVMPHHQDGQDYYETIDGQQRLTTLTIIMIVLRSMLKNQRDVSWFVQPNISYDHRPAADDALRSLSYNQEVDHPSAKRIYEVYSIVNKNLINILKNKGDMDIAEFYDYFTSNVIIMRIPVPKDTQLNHYFEIMNSRGEQLEKHEVLKASLMDCIPVEGHALFNALWEACSNMNVYVQMSLHPSIRSILFNKEWDDYCGQDFDSLLSDYNSIDDTQEEEEDGYISRTIAQLFGDADKNRQYTLPSDNNESGSSDRFGAVVTFPNFLLHVLKVMVHDKTKCDGLWEKDSNEWNELDNIIKLDDKRLLDIFYAARHTCINKETFVKRFIMFLVQSRFWLDKYVIRRENYSNREGMCLKCLKKYSHSKVNYVGTFNSNENEDDISKDIRMLQGMFHFSSPTPIYKHWLNAILHYINTRPSFSALEYREFLYNLAVLFMRDRYLAPDNENIDFEDMIYSNNFEIQNTSINLTNIHRGCKVENFIFNFYDYLIWHSNPSHYSHFEFSARTSVEHFYHHTPKLGYSTLPRDVLDSFGNLCLITRHFNSRFSNDMPNAKCSNYRNEMISTELSLKLLQMMDITKANNDWTTSEIEAYSAKAEQIISDAIK